MLLSTRYCLTDLNASLPLINEATSVISNLVLILVSANSLLTVFCWVTLMILRMSG